MRDPDEIYNMQDLELNDSRASALLLAIESCRKMGEWNELSQRAYWFLAALWNGNQASWEKWESQVTKALDDCLERLA